MNLAKIALRTLTVCLLLLKSVSAAAAPPRVAVFWQPGFPSYNASPLLSPKSLMAALNAAGFDAVTLDANALSDSTHFNAHSFAALVLPYGNAYPVAAFANLCAFHRAGGSLILSGIPFTHPIAKNGDLEWTDQGHQDAPALFGPQGIGVGGFAPPDGKPVTVAPGDPLRLASLPVDWASLRSLQRLDRTTLPKSDRVVSLIGPANAPVAALIIHEGDAFSGAIDAWTNTGPDSSVDAYGSEQLLLRGTVAVLEAKGVLTNTQRRLAFAALDTRPRPALLTNLTLPKVPRPYATFQPTLPTPARHLYVADVRALNSSQRLLLLSLQGLINRKQPRIYLIVGDQDEFWLTAMQAQGQTDAPVRLSEPMRLLSLFPNEIKGSVVPDPNIYVTPDVAADVSGADNLLIATPELAAQYHLPIKVDLRGKFKDDFEALRWVREILLPKLNPYLALCVDPAILDTGAIDQIIAAKGIAFWVTGPKTQTLPGADEQGELREVSRLMAAMPLGATVRGFWWHGDGNGLSEGDGVSLGSRFGKVTVVSDYVANFSVFSGVHIAKLHQKPAPPPPAFDPTKTYLAFTISDGDNLCTWRNYFQAYFTDPLHGTFPVGWGMGPTLIDNAPVLAQWYYDHAAPTDEFICDVSGVGYIYPPDWATALHDRDGAFRYFYAQTQAYMTRMDMKTIRLMSVGTDDIAQVGSLLPHINFLMPDYGYAGEKSPDALSYSLPSGQAVFRAVTDGSGPETLASQIRARLGSRHPAFGNVFIWNWGSKLSDLKKTLDLLGPDYVPVTPSQLAALYRQSQAGRNAPPRSLVHGRLRVP